MIYESDNISVFHKGRLDGKYILVDHSCEKCSYPLEFDKTCPRPQSHSPSLDRIYSIGLYFKYDKKYYDYLSKHIVQAKQSVEICELLGQAIARLIIRRDQELLQFQGIVPVPLTDDCLHVDKTTGERFNQAYKIADSISKITKLPLMQALVKTRDNSQRGRDAEQRKQSTVGLYRFNTTITIPQSVILIDDVTTTGSTLTECSNELSKAGIKKVSAYVCGINHLS